MIQFTNATRPASPATPVAPLATSRPTVIAHPEGLHDFREGPYLVRFARDAHDLELVQRLRFEVFNQELGEGLASSWNTGLDADEFDASCHHLMIVDEARAEVVGTYRLQTAEMARDGAGFYCAQEFELGSIPEILESGVELGRACVAREHRHGVGLFALWRGIAAYLAWQEKRYLFGCCSLTSQDPREGEALMRRLADAGHVRARVGVQPGFACEPASGVVPPDVPIPRLFATYLRYGAKVFSAPAIDREFGTIDYLVVLDSRSLSSRLFKLFFTGLGYARRGAAR